MKKKLQLNELNVQSFVTDANHVKGGDLTIAIANTPLCASIHQCPTIPADQCPTTDRQCPTVNNPCMTVDYKCGTDPIRGCLPTNYCTGVIDIRVN